MKQKKSRKLLNLLFKQVSPINDTKNTKNTPKLFCLCLPFIALFEVARAEYQELFKNFHGLNNKLINQSPACQDVYVHVKLSGAIDQPIDANGGRVM